MKQQLAERMQRLETDLSSNEHVINPLKRASLNLKLAEEAVREVARKFEFEESRYFQGIDEIEYSKCILPGFFSKLLFLRKCYQLEELKLFSLREKVRFFCERELEECYRFFSSNRVFCYYYLADKKDDDQFIFSDHNPGTYYSRVRDELIPRHMNNGCFLATMLLTYQQYGERLREESGFEAPTLSMPPDKKIQMKISETEIVELGEALRKLHRLYEKDKEPTQEEMIDWGKRVFGKEVSNWTQIAANIRKRKFGDLFFLDELRKNYADYNDQILNDRSAERKRARQGG